MEDTVLIRVPRTLQRRLQKMKAHPRESYGEVIIKLLDDGQ